VFWSWFNAESEDNQGKVVWEAPENARWHFGNTRALYKMYFTSEMKDSSETADESACLRFAREFMPIVNDALAQVNLVASTSGESAASSGASAVDATTDEGTVEPAESSDS
jgi:hypothetical protein